jgi:monoterpene epsilon-lactone hydrolase
MESDFSQNDKQQETRKITNKKETMTHREQAMAEAKGGSDEKTRVFHTKYCAPYVQCESKEAFVNPTTPPGTTPEDVNKQLNLDLGQTFITRKNKRMLLIIKFLDTFLFQWWEPLFFKVWAKTPLSFRRALTFGSWKIYFPLHKLLLGRKTGIHPAQSEESHALTTVLWWIRFIPVTPRRIRFALGQLHACTAHTVQAHRVQHIQEQITIPAPPQQKDHCSVGGLYLHLHRGDTATEKTIFWVYGGAYLAGDTLGNSATADWVGQNCQMDVFIPEFRLAPEADFDDVLWDVCLAYRWLSSKVDPSNILLLGISSGAATCVRLMQLIAEQQRGEEMLPSYITCLVENAKMPKGAALLAPSVDGTEPKGSFLHYIRHDLIVNESVMECGLSYMDAFIPSGRKRDYSPVYRSMQGLPPLCVAVSEHEAVYDMTIELVNRARSQGVPVTLGVWKYMFHVFFLLMAFVPEGRLSMEFVCEWLKEQGRDS